jgi:periplasmic glucans biosynthesis protein
MTSGARRDFCQQLFARAWACSLPAGCGLAAAVAQAQPASPGWTFDSVAALAAERARSPWRDRPKPAPERAALGYDAIRRIRFVPDHALWRSDGRSAELQFFPFVAADARALELFELDGGKVKPVVLPADAFDYDGVLPKPRSPQLAAGWRATWPLNDSNKRDELISFLGASYFRALGAGQRYGLSARAVAVNTVGGQGGVAASEEFPAFTHFWFERVEPGARSLRFLALLDGISLTGAYAFEVRAGTNTVVDVKARLFMRRAGVRLGLAPLSSMFFYGENQPRADDFRPEVHDSDGLLVVTAEGERIWRPLINPARTFVTSFAARSPRGFGLMQRDRQFARYEDLEALYHLRPSGWIEPLSDWGAGRVELLQFNTPDETHDNVAAYWVSDQPALPGQPLDMAWRIHWTREEMPPGTNARVVQTRLGRGWRSATDAPDAAKRAQPLVFHIDFEGEALRGHDGEDVKPVVSHNPGVNVRSVQAQPHAHIAGTEAATPSAWRVTLTVQRTDPKAPLELRVFLQSGTRALSETWSYALPAA